jgi:hypothetical protein
MFLFKNLYFQTLIIICLTLISFGTEAQAQSPQISLPNATGQNGSTVLIPLTLSNNTGSIVGYVIEVTFNPNVLQPHANPINTINSLSDPNMGAGCFVDSGTFETGDRRTLRIAAGCSRSITRSGTLLNMRFNVVGTANTPTGTTTLEFTVRSGSNPLPNIENDNGVMVSVGVANGSFTVAAPLASVTLAGRVVTTNGGAVRGAQVRLTSDDGSIKTVMTSAFGNYRFANVQAGQSVTIQIFSKRFGFQPQSVNVSGDIFDLNFVAQALNSFSRKK